MKHPIFNLKNWRLIEKDKIFDNLLKKKKLKERKGGIWENDGSLSPLEFYSYLKARFGEPNGYMMLLKVPTMDNLIHWHYMLKSENCFFNILGLNYRTEIHVDGASDFKEREWKNLILRITEDYKNYRKEMSKIKKSFEKWYIFINPYNRIKRIIDKYLERLNKLSIENIPLPGRPRTEKEIKEYGDKFKHILGLYRETAAIGISLQFLTPVLGEAFINLLIFILAKPEIRAEKRLFDNIMRQQIDIRIKTIHLNCIGFKRPINTSKREFKNFHTLMNQRNEILHGNIDPKRLSFEEMYFDQGNIPLFNREISSNELVLTYSLKQIEPKHVKDNVQIIKDFIGFVLDHLHPLIRRNIEVILEHPELGWRADKFRVGVILPKITSEIILPVKE